MPSKNKSATEKSPNETPMVEELRTGYFHKSPFLSTFSKGMKSWKRRFFVLSKTGEDTYHLAYYRNDEKREKPVGEIDLSKVSSICTCPEKHQMWDWIQMNFKCSSASVLFLKVEDFMPKSAREYFLIGEDSEEVEGWLNELLKVLKTKTSENKVEEADDSLQMDNRYRSISAPTLNSEDCDCEELVRNRSPTEPHISEQSESLCLFTSQPLGDNPRKLSDVRTVGHCMSANKITLSDDDTDDKDEQPDTPDDITEYMDMATVQLELEQEEDTCLQTNKSTDVAEASQDLCNAPDKQNVDSSMARETPPLVEKDICVKRNDLNTSLIFTEEQGKLCVSECKQIESSHLFHKGDQILALNDLLIDSVEEIQKFIRRLSKDEVKLTVLRQQGSQPFHAESYLSH